MKHIKFVLTIILLCSQITGLAWSRLGHRLTAEIANEYLTPQARKAVDIILGHRSMADVSDWADRIRPTRRYLTWHYATLPNINSHDSIPEHDGQLYSAIHYCLNVLNVKTHSSKQEQEIALKLLIHLVGDAHQPLHVGNGQDKGGNLCRVGWYRRRKPVNLHTIWDNYLVKSTLAHDPTLVEHALLAKPNLVYIWQHTTIKNWLYESRALHSKIYPKKIHQHSFCRWHPNNLKLIDVPHLSKSYTTKMDKIVQLRLWQGGVRLAYLLNHLFDHQALLLLEHNPNV